MDPGRFALGFLKEMFSAFTRSITPLTSAINWDIRKQCYIISLQMFSLKIYSVILFSGKYQMDRLKYDI